jgi:hypothetical protein
VTRKRHPEAARVPASPIAEKIRAYAAVYAARTPEFPEGQRERARGMMQAADMVDQLLAGGEVAPERVQHILDDLAERLEEPPPAPPPPAGARVTENAVPGPMLEERLTALEAWRREVEGRTAPPAAPARERAPKNGGRVPPGVALAAAAQYLTGDSPGGSPITPTALASFAKRVSPRFMGPVDPLSKMERAILTAIAEIGRPLPVAAVALWAGYGFAQRLPLGPSCTTSPEPAQRNARPSAGQQSSNGQTVGEVAERDGSPEPAHSGAPDGGTP